METAIDVDQIDDENNSKEKIEHRTSTIKKLGSEKRISSDSTTSSDNEHALVTDITPCVNLSLFLSLTIRSVGIIFGDIGTSPLYVVNTIFDYQPTEAQCIGAISLIVWNLIVVVSLKYAIFILMADNHGEGGTFALCGLLTDEKIKLSRKIKRGIIIVSLIAASMLLGDGALTPAVSVLSAIEGLTIDVPSLTSWTVPIGVIIIVILFLVQRWGTSKIGIAFGPIMFLWFITLFTVGIWRITMRPAILRAFNPWEAFHYLLKEKTRGFYQIGGVFLSATGLEALYADLGHFGRWPVRSAWLFIVFPAVLFNYLGQGALLIADPTLIDNPFYHSIPKWSHWPMIVLATAATIIASQAIITGSFSLISQAIGMECSVPFKIYHTSKTIVGQIYIPAINYVLMCLTIIIMVGFGKSSKITNAYGVTVCSVMLITTVLYMCVMHFTWNKPWYVIVLFGLFLIIDMYTWASNATKIPSGGWVAIVISIFFFIFGFCWYFGQMNLRRFQKVHTQTTSLHTLAIRLGLSTGNTRDNSRNSLPDLPIISTANPIDFHDDSDSNSDDEFQVKNKKTLPKVHSRVRLVENIPVRSVSIISSYLHNSNNGHEDNTIPAVVTPFVGCFLSSSTKHTPHVFENYLTRTSSVPQVIIFLHIVHTKTSTVKDNKRLTVKQYGDSIYHITALYGYSENRIKPFDILLLAHDQCRVPIPDDELKLTLFIPNATIKVSTKGWRSWIRRWPLYLYSILKSIYPGAAVNVKLNPENTINIGILAKL
ncbi:unnamed protein product [Adineta steineri]|uniref:Potassium transporter n=1 Tax=Adineta steineri TaxID=433720 RepID=A0A813ZP35_9BILA|nr:unnamed protein product [Adineta steineri]CAF1120776.1 unnamed protein product [Adineta steineri]CAF3529664.1 unnamed protein product [Adineta steineri]CAF3973736.1 unnamed protein product [Adineta steineri]